MFQLLIYALFTPVQVRRLQLQQEAEKRRVLEDALHVLAREHFVMEQSIRCQNIVSSLII